MDVKKVGVVIAVAVLGLTGTATAATPHPTYSAVASAIAGKPTLVECFTAAEWGANPANGQALWGGNYIRLAPWTCAALEDFPNRLGTVYCATSRTDWGLRVCASFQRAAFAARTLTHEALHIAGVFSETDAECQSFAHLRRTATLLGAPAYVDWVYQAERWWWETQRFPGYYVPDCPY